MTISTAIREKRKAAHVTQVELAYKVGVSNKTVQRWESGERVPGAGDLPNIATALGTTVAYLMGESGTPIRMTKEKLEKLAEIFGRTVRELNVEDIESLENLLGGINNLNVQTIKTGFNENSIVGGSGNSLSITNGHMFSAEAEELLRIFEVLDVKKRHKLLDLAFTLEGKTQGDNT